MNLPQRLTGLRLKFPLRLEHTIATGCKHITGSTYPPPPTTWQTPHRTKTNKSDRSPARE